MFGIIAIGIVVLVVVLLLVGGNHGPRRHLGAGDTFQASIMQLGNLE